jgi:hypothetical protein
MASVRIALERSKMGQELGCGLRSAFGIAPMTGEPSRGGVLSMRVTPCMTRKGHCEVDGVGPRHRPHATGS